MPVIVLVLVPVVALVAFDRKACEIKTDGDTDLIAPLNLLLQAARAGAAFSFPVPMRGEKAKGRTVEKVGGKEAWMAMKAGGRGLRGEPCSGNQVCKRSGYLDPVRPYLNL